MKRRTLTLAIAALCALVMAGCATLGGQNLDPVADTILSALGSKTKVLDFDAKTYIDGANACNAQAAKDYNAAMLLCGNPSQVVALINNTPAGILVTAQAANGAVQVLTAKCTIDGFLPGMAATIQQTTCPTGVTIAVPPSTPVTVNGVKTTTSLK